MENLPGLLLDTDLFNSPFFKNFIVPSICSSIFSISDAFDVEGGMPFIPFKSPLVQTGSFSLFSKFSARLTFPAFFRLSFFFRFSCSRFFRISIIAVNSLHSYIQFYKTTVFISSILIPGYVLKYSGATLPHMRVQHFSIMTHIIALIHSLPTKRGFSSQRY